MGSFNEDLKIPDLDDEKYENTLKQTLQKHAPQKRRIITPRPSSPWYNE